VKGGEAPAAVDADMRQRGLARQCAHQFNCHSWEPECDG
jgi:hypothetical protein